MKITSKFPVYKYICLNCVFNSNNIKDYNKHLDTDKHYKKINNIIKINQCEYCDKIFNSQSSHSRHKKTCKIKKQHEQYEEQIIQQKQELDEQHVELIKQQQQLIEKESELIKYKDKIKLLELQDKDNEIQLLKIQLQQAEQNKIQHVQIVDVSNNIINTGNTTTNNNTINKTIFNLNIFLNETCKEAISIDNFMKNYQFGYEDFLKIGTVGFTKAIINSLTQNLDLLGISKRPIHCIDLKRNLFCIKDKDNNWIKDSSNNEVIKKTIDILETRALVFGPEYTQKNPKAKKDNIYFCQAILSPPDNPVQKIISHLSTQLKIDK